MRVIFLDIDGVLNTYSDDGPGVTGTDRQFHEPAVRALNRLIKKTKAKIVITSMWRVLDVEIAKAFREEGIVGEIIGETPVVGVRAEEITAWLKGAPEPVESFVIIDDIDMELSTVFPGRLVNTNPGKGLDVKGVEQATTILSGPCL